MTQTTFNLENISYSYVRANRKWIFASPATKYSVLINCRGQNNAHKVAKIVSGAVKRCGALDGLGKSHVAKLVGRVY